MKKTQTSTNTLFKIKLIARITVSAENAKDSYYIEQGDNGRFYITSTFGYNGFEGEGHASIESALKQAKSLLIEDLKEF